MEQLRPWAEQVVDTAKHVGSFVMERLRGGAWADVTKEVEPANIQVYKGENNGNQQNQ